MIYELKDQLGIIQSKRLQTAIIADKELKSAGQHAAGKQGSGAGR